ncbi:MAG: nucleotidyltransferase family protein [Alphaproteobacteria bacterium]
MGDDRQGVLIDLIRSDPSMMAALAAVRDLDLPHGWIAAGFVRNRVWDHLHGHAEPTPPNDIDVVYFDPNSQDEVVEKRHEAALQARLPGQPWSVKNQARMAGVNGDPPYRDLAHALACWCETPTPVGARLTAAGGVELIAPLGLDDLFDLIVRPTPHARSHPAKLAQYRERMARKNWPRLWPGIRVLHL